jgi:hypothetical protein
VARRAEEFPLLSERFLSNERCCATDIDRGSLWLSTRRRSSLRLAGGYWPISYRNFVVRADPRADCAIRACGSKTADGARIPYIPIQLSSSHGAPN